MKKFLPEKAFFDPRSLNYNIGQNIKKILDNNNIPYFISRQVTIEGDTIPSKYASSKKTLFITVNKQKKLSPCKPSADYQFHLSKSCPGHCEYCYLQTTQGEKPFLYVYVNIDDILKVIDQYTELNIPNITYFESGSLTDPVALEHLTGALSKCIDYFSKSKFGRLRVITKYDNVDSFLRINHNNHTKFRFSLNTDYIIRSFEHGTANYNNRILAAKKIAFAGYPLGFIIAPIIRYPNWSSDYEQLLSKLKESLKDYDQEISFELIQHRFTKPAKELIMQRFSNTKLDMDEEKRQLKWGPYGKFKYIYKKDESIEIEQNFRKWISYYFPKSVIEYFT